MQAYRIALIACIDGGSHFGATMELHELCKLVIQTGKSNFQGRLLAVDPGETTGVTVLEVDLPHRITLCFQDQLDTWPIENAVHNFSKFIERYATWRPFVIHETYHVYKWRLQEHSFSEVPTIQIIGCLLTLCVQRGIPYGQQTAQVGKGFYNDDRLKRFQMYIEGQPHARDSLRHAAQFLTFGLKGAS